MSYALRLKLSSCWGETRHFLGVGVISYFPFRFWSVEFHQVSCMVVRPMICSYPCVVMVVGAIIVIMPLSVFCTCICMFLVKWMFWQVVRVVSLYQPFVETLVVCHCWEAAKPGRVRVTWVAVGCHKHLRNLDQTAQPSACCGAAMIQMFEDVLKGLEFCNFYGGPLQTHIRLIRFHSYFSVRLGK